MISRVLPVGAIIPFDLSTGCPEGWSRFERAGGRTLIGAGPHTNLDRSGRPISSYQVGQFGGEEQHQLTIDEISPHDHKIQTARARNMQGANDYTFDEFVGRDDPNVDPKRNHISYSEKEGGGKPFNVMGPYIALSFCRRD